MHDPWSFPLSADASRRHQGRHRMPCQSPRVPLQSQYAARFYEMAQSIMFGASFRGCLLLLCSPQDLSVCDVLCCPFSYPRPLRSTTTFLNQPELSNLSQLSQCATCFSFFTLTLGDPGIFVYRQSVAIHNCTLTARTFVCRHYTRFV